MLQNKILFLRYGLIFYSVYHESPLLATFDTLLSTAKVVQIIFGLYARKGYGPKRICALAFHNVLVIEHNTICPLSGILRKRKGGGLK